MNTLLKWILIIVGVVALLLAVTAIVLPLTFDPNDYKAEISQAVKKETGRDLSIAGDIGWTVFPWLGLEVNDVTLGNREGFGSDPMLIIGQAGAAVKIMPLFSKQVEIGKITLSDMSVNLSQKANGQNNWDDLGDDAGSSPEDISAEANSDISSIQISGIDIRNANIRWDDAGEVIELNRFNLSASGIADQQPFDVTGDFAVALKDPVLDGEVTFSSHIIPPAGNQGLQLEGLTFGFDGRQGAAPDTIDLIMAISTNATFNEETDSASLDQFEMDLHDMSVTGNLGVTSLSDTPVATGAIKIADFNLKQLLKNLGMEAPVTSNPDALTHFSAQMNFSGSANGTEWQGLKLKLDQSNLDGRFKLSNFDSPNLDFDMAIDSINLDDYMPPAGDSGNKAGGTAGNSSAGNNPANNQQAIASETDLTSDTFRGLNGGGKFKIGQLKIADLTATNVSTTLTANSNGWRFYPTVADFYGGKNQSDIRIDASGNRPVLIMSEDLSGVQAEGLLADLTNQASRLLGTGSLKLNIRSDLSNSSTLRNTMSGDLSMSVADGAFVGFDVAATIDQAKSLLGKQDEVTEQLDGDEKTEFALLGMTALINNGILTSDDFDMSSTLMRASGKGQINLVNETIDYVVKPILSENVRGEGRSTLGKLSGVPIPIKISGSLYDPSISIDFIGAVTESQKAKIDEKKTELTNKLFDKLLGSDDDDNVDDKTGNTQSTDSNPDNKQSSTTQAQGSVDDAEASEDAEAEEDPVDSLINSLFSSKKDKKDKKDKKNKAKDNEDTPPD